MGLPLWASSGGSLSDRASHEDPPLSLNTLRGPSDGGHSGCYDDDGGGHDNYYSYVLLLCAIFC